MAKVKGAIECVYSHKLFSCLIFILSLIFFTCHPLAWLQFFYISLLFFSFILVTLCIFFYNHSSQRGHPFILCSFSGRHRRRNVEKCQLSRLSCSFCIYILLDASDGQQAGFVIFFSFRSVQVTFRTMSHFFILPVHT